MDERLYAIQKMVSHGIDELVVTLTFVPGLGGVSAKRLAENGIRDIEELAFVRTIRLGGSTRSISNKSDQMDRSCRIISQATPRLCISRIDQQEDQLRR